MSENSTLIGTSILAEKSTLPDFASLEEAAEFFDTQDMSEYLEKMPEVHFEISPRARRKRYPLDDELSEKLAAIAQQRGISAEDLLNQWVREKAAENQAVGAAK